jgi:hypothetical protein
MLTMGWFEITESIGGPGSLGLQQRCYLSVVVKFDYSSDTGNLR